jgi:hypothetical protein
VWVAAVEAARPSEIDTPTDLVDLSNPGFSQFARDVARVFFHEAISASNWLTFILEAERPEGWPWSAAFRLAATLAHEGRGLWNLGLELVTQVE